MEACMHACTQQSVDRASASVRRSDSFVNLDLCVEDGFFFFFGVWIRRIGPIFSLPQLALTWQVRLRCLTAANNFLKNMPKKHFIFDKLSDKKKKPFEDSPSGFINSVDFFQYLSFVSWLFQIWEKSWGHRVRFFRNWGWKLEFFVGFLCVSQGFTTPNRCSKKELYLEFFSKTAGTFLIHFSWKWERKNRSHRARFCSTNKTVSDRHWHSCHASQILKAIKNNLVQYKTVASNLGLAMARSVKLWTLDPLDRDSHPVQQRMTVQWRHNWVELP